MRQNQAADPLAGLRDIHIPDAVSWWPLAPGWWGLGAVMCMALVLVWLWRRKRRQRYYQRVALRHLEHLEEQFIAEPETLVRELSVLLRRVATLYYPDSAGLAGREWLKFLDRTLDAKAEAYPFSAGEGQCLADAPYRPALKSEVDTRTLVELARRWIRSLPLHNKTGREIC
ncbi:MAG: DUF4381 domain-containing protein [Geobacteraceae bacterium]|nr:DUF4381 domain-containing protein [Geobacteraceae bacterium]